MADLVRVVAALYSVLFTAAVIGKLDGWAKWQDAMAQFIQRRSIRRIAVFGIPVAEIGAVGTNLIWPAHGMLLSAVILTFFMVGLAIFSVKHKGADCGCFGVAMPSVVGPGLVLRNAVLAATAAATYLAVPPGRVDGFSGWELAVVMLSGITILFLFELKNFFGRVRQATRREAASG